MPRDRGFADAVRDRDQDKPCPWGTDIFTLWPVQQPKRSSRPALGRARSALAAARGWWRGRRSQPRLFLYLLVTQLLELADEVALAAVVDGADRGWDQRLKATARSAATRTPGAVQGGLCLTALPACLDRRVLVPGKVLGPAHCPRCECGGNSRYPKSPIRRSARRNVGA